MKKYLGFIVATFLVFEGFGVSSALAGDKYGAVATGPDGAYGYAYNYNTQDEAEARALYECGSTCSVKVWFANACGAVAKGAGYLGWAWNPDETVAKTNALNQCGNASCEIAAGACTDR